MFTLGIFTSHFPYIAFVVFYAYFLIFGVNKASEGKIQIAEKSITVQFHKNNSFENNSVNTFSFYTAVVDQTETFVINLIVKQKWKHFGVNKVFQKIYYLNTLFGRPPPVLA